MKEIMIEKLLRIGKQSIVDMKYQSLILICLFTSSANAGLSDLMHNDPWKFLQDKFITAPNAKASETMPTTVKSLLSLGIAIGSNAIYKKIYTQFLTVNPYNTTSGRSGSLVAIKLSELTNNLRIPISIASGCLAFYKMHNALVTYHQHKALIDILNDWPQVKSHVPSKLQPGFEEVYKAYKAHPTDFEHKSSDIIRVIKQQIEEHFEPNVIRKFWDAKILGKDDKVVTSNTISDIANTLSALRKYF